MTEKDGNRRNPLTVAVITEHQVQLDNTLPFERRIAAGKYDFVNPDIMGGIFPITPLLGPDVVTMTLKLVMFEKKMSAGEVRSRLRSLGLQPASIEHLLALGAQYPDLQRAQDIVALGSVGVSEGEAGASPFLSSGPQGPQQIPRELLVGWFTRAEAGTDTTAFLVFDLPS